MASHGLLEFQLINFSFETIRDSTIDAEPDGLSLRVHPAD